MMMIPPHFKNKRKGKEGKNNLTINHYATLFLEFLIHDLVILGPVKLLS